MGRKSAREGIALSDEDRERLKQVLGNPRSPQRHVWRTGIILKLASGYGLSETIADGHVEADGLALMGPLLRRGRLYMLLNSAPVKLAQTRRRRSSLRTDSYTGCPRWTSAGTAARSLRIPSADRVAPFHTALALHTMTFLPLVQCGGLPAGQRPAFADVSAFPALSLLFP